LKTICNTITNALCRNKYEKELEQTQSKLQYLLNIRTLELHKNENYYKALIETQQDLICRWFPDTTLTFVNDAYCKFFNTTDSAVIGKKWVEITGYDSSRYFEAAGMDILKTGNPVTYEHAIKKPDGELCWHQWINTPIKNQDGVTVEIQSAGRD